MELFSGDVETAFLTPDIDAEIWVTMPPMYGEDGSDVDTNNQGCKQVRRLLKGVPGIPQGGKLFYDKFSAILLKCGFTQSVADKCLFIRTHELPFGSMIFSWRSFLDELRKDINVTGSELTQFLGLILHEIGEASV